MSPTNKSLIRLLVAALLLAGTPAAAQRVMVKTNGLGWATLSPNLGLEFRLSRHTTLNLEGAANPFTVKNYKLHHATAMPEVRYWFSARPQARHFCGLMGLGSIYNVRIKDEKHDGSAVGLGLTYGYSFVLGQRFSLELTAGAGFLHATEKKYHYRWDVPEHNNHTLNTLAPLKAGVTLVYLIR